MSNTIQLEFSDECLNYDLYISSRHRRSMFGDGSSNNDTSTLRISMLKLMNDTSPSIIKVVKQLLE